MRNFVFGWFAVAMAVFSPALAHEMESIPDAVKRMDGQLQELEKRSENPRPAYIENEKEDSKYIQILGYKKQLMQISEKRLGFWDNYVRSESETNRASFGRMEYNSQSGYGMSLHDASGERKFMIFVGDNGKFFTIDPYGHIHRDTSARDYAEIFELATREGVRAGAVVAWNPKAGGVEPASRENARLVVGAVAGAGGLRSGMVIGSRADGSTDFPVAVSGMIYALVSDEAGAVAPGDLLVPSSTPGVGMRAGDPVAAGTVYGKALEPWAGPGEGLVLMLVMHR